MSLAQRSVHSASWTTISTLVALPVTLIQSIILARLLPVEYFGILAGVTSIILLSSTVFEFGFTSAFIHRAAETEDENLASAVYFTLRVLSELVWAFILIGVGWILFSDLRQFVLIFLVISSYLQRFTLTPRVLLIRRVEHRRLAILDLIANLISAALSILIAYFTRSIWALLISSIVSLFVAFFGLYLWKPFWKPKLIFDRKVIRYYFSFGSKNLVNNILDTALDNLDNLWTNYFLGDLLLGYYSRAFKFSTYPRLVLSNPMNVVIIGTYAEAKYDRHRLSRAFFQTNAFLIRTGFLFSGWLAVIAPEFIRLLLGVRWLPMLDAFRLMLIFCMLDPIKVSVSNVLTAVGKPEKISVVRVAQVIVLLIGLFALGIRFEIAGVAMAMDLMVVTGTLMALLLVKAYVDVSMWKLFAAPGIALAAALGMTWLVGSSIETANSDWLTGFVKTIVFALVYILILFGFEGKKLFEAMNEMIRLFPIKQLFDSVLKRSS